MKYKTYPKMRDSGVEWIEDIPEHWKIKKLKYVLLPKGLVRGPFGSNLKIDSFIKEGYKVYEQKNAIYQDLQLGDSYISERKKKELNRFSIKKNDFLMSCSGTIGKFVLIPNDYKEGIINQALLIIRFSQNSLELQFMKHLMNSTGFQKMIIDNSQGGAMKNLIGIEDFKQIKIPVPNSIDEQKKISEYLEKKIKKIELEIKNNQKIIRYLEGKKHTLINCGVTKGLDPTVPMKETGVKWIGKIPEHWMITKLDYFYEIQLGKMLQPESIGDDDILIKYLNTDFVQWDSVDLINLPKMWINPSHVFKYQIKKNDLLICEGGSYPGRSAIVSEVNDTIIIQNALHRIRPKEKSTNRFLYYIMYCEETLVGLIW